MWNRWTVVLVGSLGLASAAVGQWGCPEPEWVATGSVPGAQYYEPFATGAVRTMRVLRPPGASADRLVIGGYFDIVGPVSSPGVAQQDLETGEWSDVGGGVHGSVSAVVIASNGDLVVAGDFDLAGKVPALSIASWDGEHWTPFGEGIGKFGGVGYALALTVDGDAVIAGGGFNFAGNVYGPNIARWDGTLWHPIGEGLNEDVRALITVPSGDVVAGGAFTGSGSTPMKGAAIWNGVSWQAMGGGVSGAISEFALTASGDLIASGLFTHAGGVVVNHVARWDGEAWSALGSGITKMATYAPGLTILANGDIVVSGAFYEAGGVPATNIARWNGAEWSGFGDGLSSSVYGVAPAPDGRVFAGGAFMQWQPEEALYLARWDGQVWAPMAPDDQSNPSSTQSVCTTPDGGVVVGGKFADIFGVPANGVARWDDGRWSSLGAGLGPPSANIVRALVSMKDGSIIAGGAFTESGGKPLNHVARWNGTEWLAMGDGLGGTSSGYIVYALEVAENQTVFAGGFFLLSGSNTVNYVGAWDGASWQPLGSGVTNVVRALTLGPMGALYVGGDFLSAGGKPASRVAQWDGVQWLPLGSGVGGVGAQVAALCALPNGDVIAGGTFTHAGGLPANRVARWDGAAWSALGKGIDALESPAVHVLRPLSDGSVLVGGHFDFAGGEAISDLARWDGSVWSDVAGGIQGSAVTGLAGSLDGGSLFAVGTMWGAGTACSLGFAHLMCRAAPCLADCDASGSLDIDDFICFQTLYAIGDSGADCDGNATLNLDDFVCFQSSYAVGC